MSRLDELCRMYAEKSDAELLTLSDGFEDLTDDAQQALTKVMGERGLERDVEATGEVAEQVEASSEELHLWTFDDAFQAGEAIRLLDEAEIWHRIEDASIAEGKDLRSQRVRTGLMLMIQRADEAVAVKLLQEKMRLFPEPERGYVGGSPMGEMDGLSMVAMFDRATGLMAAEVLGEAGISYFWRDGRDEPEEAVDEQSVAIEVRTAQLKRATELIERRLAAEETGSD